MTRPELIEAMARAIYERVNGAGCRAWRLIDHKAAYRDQATAALAAIETAGCVIVPKEPTPEMIAAALPITRTASHDDLKIGAAAVLLLSGPRHIENEGEMVTEAAALCVDYRAMLAASPLAKDA